MYCGQQPSDDDIPSCVEIPFDRVAPLNLALQQIFSNIFDSTAPKYYFDGGFVFSLFDKVLNLKELVVMEEASSINSCDICTTKDM